MKKIKFTIALISIFAIAFLANHFLFAGTSIASLAGILPAVIKADASTINQAVMDTMSKESPTALGFYTGQNNHSLSFSGGSATSFIDEPLNTAEFGLRIINASATMKTVVLCPAYFSTFGNVTENIVYPVLVTEDVVVTVAGQSRTITVITTNTPTTKNVIVGFMLHDVTQINNRHGVTVDAVIDDGVVLIDGGKNVTVSSLSKGLIQDFLSFVKKNPTRVTEITVASNNVSQYGRKVTVKRVNPAGDWGEEYIQLTKYFETSQFRTEKIIVDTNAYNLQFDDQTLILFEVEAAISSTVPTQTDLTMKLGASINDANELMGLAHTAKKVIAIAQSGLKGV